SPAMVCGPPQHPKPCGQFYRAAYLAGSREYNEHSSGVRWRDVAKPCTTHVARAVWHPGEHARESDRSRYSTRIGHRNDDGAGAEPLLGRAAGFCTEYL